MSRKLIVNDGRHEREMLLVAKIVVGRDPLCDISDGDALLSRRHAEFIASEDGVVVRDLGSRNGIFVNGTRVAEGALRPGDTVQVGHLQLRFVEDGSPIAAAPEMADDEATAVIYTPPRPGMSPAPSSAVPVPPPPAAARPTSAPPPALAADEDDADQTSLIPPPVLHQSARPGSGSTPPVPPMPPPNPSESHPAIAADEDDQTRVVATPELRAAIHIAMTHPAPSPAQAAAQVFAPSGSGSGVAPTPSSGVAPVPAAAVSGSGVSSAAPAAGTAPPPARVTTEPARITPPASPGATPATMPSAPAPAAPAATSGAAAQPWPMFVQTRLGFVAGAVVISALALPALNQTLAVTALLTIAVGGLAAFVVSAMIIEQTNHAVEAFKQDLAEALDGRLDAVRDSMGTAPSRDLADALNGLVARVRAAEAHRR